MSLKSPSSPPLPPPVLFAVFFGTGYLLHRALPLRVIGSEWGDIPAILLGLAGVVLLLAAAFALRRARTTTSPFKTPSSLVTTSPFLRTRNPVYLAYAWIYLGGAFRLGSAWPFLLFPVLVVIVNRIVIRREEALLEERFGEAYREYRARARRWM